MKPWKTIFKTAHNCLICADCSPQRLCHRCHQLLTPPSNPCIRCGISLPQENKICGHCLRNTPSYDHIVVPFLYQPPLKQLIADFKTSDRSIASKLLRELFCEQLVNHYRRCHTPVPDVITPVPLHFLRRWQRGFNQAAVLSCVAAGALNIEHRMLCKRVGLGTDQKQLSRRRRLDNLVDSFRVTGSVRHQHIAIVDDVMTTGATLNSLAKVLKDAGAKEVTAWVLARTPLEQKKKKHG